MKYDRLSSASNSLSFTISWLVICNTFYYNSKKRFTLICVYLVSMSRMLFSLKDFFYMCRFVMCSRESIALRFIKKGSEFMVLIFFDFILFYKMKTRKTHAYNIFIKSFKICCIININRLNKIKIIKLQQHWKKPW